MALTVVAFVSRFTLEREQMHTPEDFTAHSNFCELALQEMGHHNVFLHVGDRVRVHARNGKSVAPLVTGEHLFSTVFLGGSECLNAYNI
jgi:hypothetical protein